jgi:hypothetical protein
LYGFRRGELQIMLLPCFLPLLEARESERAWSRRLASVLREGPCSLARSRESRRRVGLS